MALFNLGNIYYNGIGIIQDLTKAKKYFELAIEYKNENACIGEKKDFKKYIYYLELAVKYNHIDAFDYLAFLYLHGIGVKRDISKARNLFEISAYANNTFSLINLGYEYSSGEVFETDFNKSIDYYKKCINVIEGDIKNHFHSNNFTYTLSIFCSECCYFSYNDLGLIYLLNFDDRKKAEFYIKKSANNGFQHGQYSLGLINYFYLGQKEYAIYMLKNASKNKFALAEYFLGHIKEEDSTIEDAIEFYKKASEYQNIPFIFRSLELTDSRHMISQIFIICLTNLKLVEYFYSQSNYEEMKKYFIRSLSKFNLSDKYNDPYQFELKFDNNNINESFSYLKKFIFSFPLFDPNKNPNYYSVMDCFSEEDPEQNKKTNKIEKIIKNSNSKEKEKINLEKDNLKNMQYKSKFINNSNDFKKEINNKEIESNLNTISDKKDELIFDDPSEFFDFVINNKEHRDSFIHEIKNIINDMNEIIYKPPYFILFGRMSIEKTKYKEVKYANAKNIDESFYEGFSIDI